MRIIDVSRRIEESESVMVDVLPALVRSLVSALRSRANLTLENVALRHQLMVAHRHGRRPRLTEADRAVWVVLRHLWSGWKGSLVIVKPATVVAWHRAGFRGYWTWKSGNAGGRPRLDPEHRNMIRQMWRDNSTWGSPRI